FLCSCLVFDYSLPLPYFPFSIFVFNCPVIPPILPNFLLLLTHYCLQSPLLLSSTPFQSSLEFQRYARINCLTAYFSHEVSIRTCCLGQVPETYALCWFLAPVRW